jgi:hypothetical protein
MSTLSLTSDLSNIQLKYTGAELVTVDSNGIEMPITGTTAPVSTFQIVTKGYVDAATSAGVESIYNPPSFSRVGIPDTTNLFSTSVSRNLPLSMGSESAMSMSQDGKYILIIGQGKPLVVTNNYGKQFTQRNTFS